MTENTALTDPEPAIQPGRPRLPLLVGQRLYIERAYVCLGMSQAHIAQQVGVAIPRVRRHLIDQGLYEPRTSKRSQERAAVLKRAIQDYRAGIRVVTICQQYGVNPAELYREIRRLDVPFRIKHQQHHTPVGEAVDGTRRTE